MPWVPPDRGGCPRYDGERRSGGGGVWVKGLRRKEASQNARNGHRTTAATRRSADCNAIERLLADPLEAVEPVPEVGSDAAGLTRKGPKLVGAIQSAT